MELPPKIVENISKIGVEVNSEFKIRLHFVLLPPLIRIFKFLRNIFFLLLKIVWVCLAPAPTSLQRYVPEHI